jgi:hypothetical protein
MMGDRKSLSLRVGQQGQHRTGQRGKILAAQVLGDHYAQGTVGKLNHRADWIE